MSFTKKRKDCMSAMETGKAMTSFLIKGEKLDSISRGSGGGPRLNSSNFQSLLSEKKRRNSHESLA